MSLRDVVPQLLYGRLASLGGASEFILLAELYAKLVDEPCFVLIELGFLGYE